MDWMDVTLIGLLAGVLGTGLGGVLSFFVSRPSDRAMGVVLALAAGAMLSIIFSGLIDEAVALSFAYTALGLAAGIAIFSLLDSSLPHMHFFSEETGGQQLQFTRKGLLIAIGIALHNLPEGIAIGAGFAASGELGLSLALLIGLHNIPEGMAVSIPLIAGGTVRWRAALYALAAGLPMGAGALCGSLAANISPFILAISLGFAGGAMLYIVCDELIPDVYQLAPAHLSILGIATGVLAGMAMSYFL